MNTFTGRSGARQSAAPRRSRRRRDWLAGLPAALIGVVTLAVGLAAAATTPEQIRFAYANQARLADQAGDHRMAKLCFERLALAPDSPTEAQYRLAESLEALGERRRALAILRKLAPDDRPGDPFAQLRLALLLLSEKPTPPAAAVEAERHLRRSVEGDPNSVPANALLAQILIATSRQEQSVPHLRRVVWDRPELRITLARVYRAMSQPEAANDEANLALREFRRRSEANPDDPEARVRWAEAAAFLGDFPTAANVLGEGWQRTKDPRYRPTLASLYAAWASIVRADPKAAPGKRLDLLEQGLQLDPNNQALLNEFSGILRANGAEAERARAVLRDQLTKGENVAGAHFVLGVDAWFRDRPDEARIHYEQADRLAPGSAEVVNNLAWVLIHTEPPDLRRALTLADAAVERRPDNALFHGTRGVALARLGRWKDALPDLETALPASPREPALRQALVDTYEHLGLSDMAAAHRRELAGLAKPKG
jgi:tetratricopeptide (TPR) repeat protein